MNAAEDRHPIELKSNAEEIKKLGMSNMKSSYKIHLFSGFDMGKKLLFLPSVTYSFSENSLKQGRENLVGKSGYLTWSAGCWWRTNAMMIKSKSNKKKDGGNSVQIKAVL